MIFAINGPTGHVIWTFHELEVETNSPIVMDLYTINVLRDLDGDAVPEVIAAHLEEREESKAGHIKLISGRTGKVIRTIPTPHREEMFVPIQQLTLADGTDLLLMITGGQNTPGGIYSLRLLSLMAHTSEKHFTPLHQQAGSGLMVPAVLSDLNGDGVSDVVVAAFNSTVFAFDGRNYSMLWNYTFPASECVSAIVPGHFDHDNVTDFMVKYNTGPGFPVYYYSQTTILDGRTGQPLLNSMMTDAGGASSLLGGVSISQSFGGDFFLHWQLQCRNRTNARDAYEFVPDSDIILQARADTCRLRYNESTVLKLYAIARHIEPPGAVLFSTDDLEVQLNRTQRPAVTGKQSPLKHPKLLKKLLANREQLLRQVAAGEQIEQQQQQPTPVKHLKHHKHTLPELLPEPEADNELPSFGGGYIKEPYKEFVRFVKIFKQFQIINNTFCRRTMMQCRCRQRMPIPCACRRNTSWSTTMSYPRCRTRTIVPFTCAANIPVATIGMCAAAYWSRAPAAAVPQQVFRQLHNRLLVCGIWSWTMRQWSKRSMQLRLL